MSGQGTDGVEGPRGTTELCVCGRGCDAAAGSDGTVLGPSALPRPTGPATKLATCPSPQRGHGPGLGSALDAAVSTCPSVGTASPRERTAEGRAASQGASLTTSRAPARGRLHGGEHGGNAAPGTQEDPAANCLCSGSLATGRPAAQPPGVFLLPGSPRRLRKQRTSSL